MRDADWDRLVRQLAKGECTPFLGAGACHPTLPMSGDLSEIWSKRCKYPFSDRRSLPQVMQFAAMWTGDPVTFKEDVCREFAQMGPPDYTDETEPHALLAKFPIPVYLTTNYDNFMVEALERENRRPHPFICPWHKNVPSPEIDDFEPCAERPIVYYLHGRCKDRNEQSLVLTEADYLEFLISLAMDRAADDRKLIPIPVLPAFTQWPLLFIGYSLQDWNFKVIYHSLRRTVAEINQRRHVSVQLLPPHDPNDRQRAEDYLTDYFDKWHISVYWGTAQEFCAKLRDMSDRLKWA